MPWHLESKKIKGNTYYYARKNKWTPKGSRRDVEIYLGSADKIVSAMTKTPSITKIKTYDFGKDAAILSIAQELTFQQIIDKCVPKTKGFSAAELMLLVPLGRSNHKTSKVKTVDWYAKSYLPFFFNLPKNISEDSLYHILDYLTPVAKDDISDKLAKRLLDLGIKPSAIFYDTTNFRTYLEESELAKKGRSKEGPTVRNLIGLALAVCDEDIPFLHESYAGNRSDKELFPIMLDKLMSRLTKVGIDTKELVLVFDRGNNSQDNIDLAKKVSGIIAGLSRNQFGDLLDILLNKFKDSYTNYKGHVISGYRTTHDAFGKKYTCVVIYNPATKKKNLAEYEKRKDKIIKLLKELEKKAARKTGRGKKMTPVSAIRHAEKAIPDDYTTVFKPDIIDCRFCWSIDEEAEEKLKKSFGRQVVITDKDDWDTVRIMKTYNQKGLIEADFKLVKDDLVIPLYPSFHRKENRIEANMFLCMTGVMFLRYMMWKLRDLRLSVHDLIEALEGIKISLTKYKGSTSAKWVVNDMDITQAVIFSRLNFQEFLPR